MEKIEIESTNTALKYFYENILEAKNLGLNEIKINTLLDHILKFKNIEESIMKTCFMDGREFQSYAENINIPFKESADKYFQENYNLNYTHEITRLPNRNQGQGEANTSGL